jgi:septal ring factor EnvC (AmiA/AmiB activator)
MKAILNILVIALCGGGIYFAQQANVKHQEQIAQYEAAKADNKKLGDNIKAAQGELAAEQDGLAQAKTDFSEKEASLDAAKSTEKTMLRQLAESEALLEEQAAKVKQQNELIEEAKKILGPGVTPDNIGEKIAEIEQSKKDQTKKLEELETLVTSATKDVAKNKENIADLAARKAKRDEKIRSNAKEAVITAVEADWGFVVIGAGSNVGFTPQTKLLVKRDGVLIGRINPTSIEPSQTIAEIETSSLAPGASIQPGDRVILAVPATR